MSGRGAPVVCVDFGSTFTKAALVDVETGELLAGANHRTTIDTDVLDGWEACRDVLVASDTRAATAQVMACSSAGGGLRVAVVGNEELVTAEAGRRVALSSGGKVVHVGSSGLAPTSFDELAASRPDVVLLVGGTDGGNAEVLEHNAAYLADAAWSGPVVVAGNVESQGLVESRFERSGTPYVLCDNVVPRIGVLAPDSARAAIREMFLRHVIGGKQLSRRADFTAMVQGPTPDLVLSAVELLARGLDAQRPGAGDVVVVDVGGATTDVHSVVEPDPEDAGLSRDVVATLPVSRTVEGDLGMRWSAETTAVEGLAAGLLTDETQWQAAAAVRRGDPAFLPSTESERLEDARLASAAVGVALRRHAGRAQVVFGPDGRVVERSGKNLRQVHLVVGSGGVLRANPDRVARGILGDALDRAVDGGWQLPEATRTVIDADYVLAPAGLLLDRHPEAAYALVMRLRDASARAVPTSL